MTGDELRERRKALGISAARLADLLGFDANTILRWERNELTISHPATLKLAIERLIDSDFC